MNFITLFNGLVRNTWVVVFHKKNGRLRVMLCTRNIDTAMKVCELSNLSVIHKMSSKESTKNSSNGYLAVFDLEACDGRLINSNRVLETIDLGELKTDGDIQIAFAVLAETKDRYSRFSDFEF